MPQNGYFKMHVRDDGLYVIIYPPVDGGEKLSWNEINFYLNENRITQYNEKMIKNALDNVQKTVAVKLSNEVIEPIDEVVQIKVSADNMSAYLRFYPPSNEGRLLNANEITSVLEKESISYGIISENIERSIKHRRYCENILVAQGLPMKPGRDAKIKYYFDRVKNYKPKENPDGSFDFHELDLINHVEEGALLAELIPAIDGESGIDLNGKKIVPEKVRKLNLKYGKNVIISEDQCKLYAENSGHVDLIDDKVVVFNVLEVKEDVDNKTGNIDYEGCVYIKGNVLTDFIVKATSDIIVEGVVEGATLIAGGQIILSRGIHGLSKGVLKAKGNIIAKFIESCIVESEGYISAGAILHSRATATGEIIVTQQKGLVAGGELKSGKMISVKTAGSALLGTNTSLEVATTPALSIELMELEKQILESTRQKNNLVQSLNYIKKRVSDKETLPPEQSKMLQNLPIQLGQLNEDTQNMMTRYQQLKEQIENNTRAGRILIDKIIYPGIKIIIANSSYYVRDEIKHTQFVNRDMEIRSIPYEEMPK